MSLLKACLQATVPLNEDILFDNQSQSGMTKNRGKPTVDQIMHAVSLTYTMAAFETALSVYEQ